jgi:hypothetical protein
MNIKYVYSEDEQRLIDFYINEMNLIKKSAEYDSFLRTQINGIYYISLYDVPEYKECCLQLIKIYSNAVPKIIVSLSE